mgnify:CR=1 FL=1
MSTIRPQNKNIYNTIYTKNTNNIDVPLVYKRWNINNTNNIINTDNTGYSCSCGSGKKYKNCCGKETAN